MRRPVAGLLLWAFGGVASLARGEGIVTEGDILETDNCSDCVKSFTVCCIISSTFVGVDTAAAAADGRGEGAFAGGSLLDSLSVWLCVICPIAGDLAGDFAGDLIWEFDGCGEDGFFASGATFVGAESDSCLVSGLLSSLKSTKKASSVNKNQWWN